MNMIYLLPILLLTSISVKAGMPLEENTYCGFLSKDQYPDWGLLNPIVDKTIIPIVLEVPIDPKRDVTYSYRRVGKSLKLAVVSQTESKLVLKTGKEVFDLQKTEVDEGLRLAGTWKNGQSNYYVTLISNQMEQSSITGVPKSKWKIKEIVSGSTKIQLVPSQYTDHFNFFKVVSHKNPALIPKLEAFLNDQRDPGNASPCLDFIHSQAEGVKLLSEDLLYSPGYNGLTGYEVKEGLIDLELIRNVDLPYLFKDWAKDPGKIIKLLFQERINQAHAREKDKEILEAKVKRTVEEEKRLNSMSSDFDYMCDESFMNEPIKPDENFPMELTKDKLSIVPRRNWFDCSDLKAEVDVKKLKPYLNESTAVYRYLFK